MARLPRVQSLFLLFIAVLLFLNILLPARYTVQLVRVTGEEREEEDPFPARDDRQQQRRAVDLQEEAADERDALLRLSNRDAEKESATVRKSRTTESRFRGEKKVAGVDFPKPEEAEVKKDYREKVKERDRERMRERDNWTRVRERERVNFHDPAQRMAYYKKLRKGLMGGSDLLSLKRNRNQRRLEMVREMWGGWFEDGEELVQLGGLREFVTADISPEAIQTELRQCAAALGVSQQRLDTQREDLARSSRKLSAFLSAVKSLVPEAFSRNFTSPCWYSHSINAKSNLVGITSRVVGLEGHLQILPNQANYLAREAFRDSFPARLFCLPHFFLAGFPKSATTTLSDTLFGHPQVSSAVVKETHWWTRAPIISPSESLLRLNVLRYLMHFRHMAHYAEERPGLLSMDASQSTLWDSNFVFGGNDFCSTPAALSHVVPRAKFLVLMREPSERLYSYYLWSCSFRYGNDTRDWPASVRRDPAGNFHTEVSHSVGEFDRCLESSSLYECANRFTFRNGTKATQYCGQIGFRLVVSIYYIHLLKFFQFFPREQFLFLKMDDMSTEPIAFLHRVTNFLDIRPYPVREVRDALERKHNRQRAGIGPMQEDTRQLLHDFFAPYNRRLARLINDERFLWGYS